MLMNKKLQYIVMILCALLIIGLAYFGITQKDKADKLKLERDNKPTPTRIMKDVSLSKDEVKENQKIVEQKIDEFLDGEYDDDDIFEDGSAGKTFYGIFALTGVKGITEDSSKKDIKKRYKKFDYELENVTAQKNHDGEVTLNASVDVKYDGKKFDTKYDLISIGIGADKKLKGGTLYGKQQ
ncbi:TPA_asm: hypothetical protein GZX72_14285 [Listeria monocytogenes]|nr:hypothetical protein [Listeria monocytogenes]